MTYSADQLRRVASVTGVTLASVYALLAHMPVPPDTRRRVLEAFAALRLELP